MSLRRWCWIACVATACGRGDSAATPGVGAAADAGADSTSTAVSGDWPPDLGSALVIPSDTESLAVMLYPTSPASVVDPKAQFVLRAPDGGAVGASVKMSGLDSAHCGDAPLLHLARPTSQLWSTGLSGASARAMQTDSLEALSASDSLLYSTEAPRLASAISARLSTRLTGLPFALTALRRVRLGDTTVVVAQLSRRVNQEANPVEERTLVVAEQVRSEPFTTVHGKRSEGTEDTAAHFELLGAFRTSTALYLIVTTDTPSGSTIEILERSGGAWRVRWTRTIAC